MALLWWLVVRLLRSRAQLVLLSLALLGVLAWCPAAFSLPLEDVVSTIKASVVAVGTFEPTRTPPFLFRGTGFAVGDGTLVATNAHVIPEELAGDKRERLEVALPATGGGAVRREATLAGLDPEHDIAVLRISGPPLPALQLAGNVAREGQSAAFTGFPIGTVLGVIPATHRATISALTPIALPMSSASQLNEKLVHRIKTGAFNVLQLDATAYPGNSGSPLYDAQSGAVLGIVNLVFVKTTKEAALSQPSGISFAVPVEHLRALLATLH